MFISTTTHASASSSERVVSPDLDRIEQNGGLIDVMLCYRSERTPAAAHAHRCGSRATSARHLARDRGQSRATSARHLARDRGQSRVTLRVCAPAQSDP